jgi:hypothetical protein
MARFFNSIGEFTRFISTVAIALLTTAQAAAAQ